MRGEIRHEVALAHRRHRLRGHKSATWEAAYAQVLARLYTLVCCSVPCLVLQTRALNTASRRESVQIQGRQHRNRHHSYSLAASVSPRLRSQRSLPWCR